MRRATGFHAAVQWSLVIVLLILILVIVLLILILVVLAEGTILHHLLLLLLTVIDVCSRVEIELEQRRAELLSRGELGQVERVEACVAARERRHGVGWHGRGDARDAEAAWHLVALHHSTVHHSDKVTEAARGRRAAARR
jgi:hypothetical protein